MDCFGAFSVSGGHVVTNISYALDRFLAYLAVRGLSSWFLKFVPVQRPLVSHRPLPPSRACFCSQKPGSMHSSPPPTLTFSAFEFAFGEGTTLFALSRRWAAAVPPCVKTLVCRSVGGGTVACRISFPRLSAAPRLVLRSSQKPRREYDQQSVRCLLSETQPVPRRSLSRFTLGLGCAPSCKRVSGVEALFPLCKTGCLHLLRLATASAALDPSAAPPIFPVGLSSRSSLLPRCAALHCSGFGCLYTPLPNGIVARHAPLFHASALLLMLLLCTLILVLVANPGHSFPRLVSCSACSLLFHLLPSVGMVAELHSQPDPVCRTLSDK